MTWILMLVLDNCDQSIQAIWDCLAQDVPTRVLVIDQGSSDATRDRLRQMADEQSRVLLWSHDPCLPSLSASWNCALEFIWAQGEDSALVVNNDTRLDPSTVRVLVRTLVQDHALLVTATGCDQAGWDLAHDGWDARVLTANNLQHHGGPDFSCFLISKECHERFPFDGRFIPAFGEDLDVHRRMMLAGEGRRIFSLNLPFWHINGGSQTMKQSPEHRKRIEPRIAISRAYYAKKWGGGCNDERFTIPFDAASVAPDVSTPVLQRRVAAGENVRVPAGDGHGTATPDSPVLY